MGLCNRQHRPRPGDQFQELARQHAPRRFEGIDNVVQYQVGHRAIGLGSDLAGRTWGQNLHPSRHAQASSFSGKGFLEVRWAQRSDAQLQARLFRQGFEHHAGRAHPLGIKPPGIMQISPLCVLFLGERLLAAVRLAGRKHIGIPAVVNHLGRNTVSPLENVGPSATGRGNRRCAGQQTAFDEAVEIAGRQRSPIVSQCCQIAIISHPGYA